MALSLRLNSSSGVRTHFPVNVFRHKHLPRYLPRSPYSFAQQQITNFNSYQVTNFNPYQGRRSHFNASPSQVEATTMTKTMKVALFLLIGVAMLVAYDLYASEQSSNDSFIDQLDAEVSNMIANATKLPGPTKEGVKLIGSAEREEIAIAWTHLIHNGVLKMSGSDEKIASYCATIQAMIETVLAEACQNKTIASFKGVAHTLVPATPNCNKKICTTKCSPDPSADYTKTGMTYLFEDKDKETYVLIVRQTTEGDKATCTIWLGPLANMQLFHIVKETEQFIEQNGEKVFNINKPLNPLDPLILFS